MHLFGDSTTILKRSQGAHRPRGDILEQHLQSSKAWSGQVRIRYLDHSVGGATLEGIMQQLEAFQASQPFIREDLPHLRHTGRDTLMPVHTRAISFWSGNNELKEKRGTITNECKCKARPATAAAVVRVGILPSSPARAR